MPAARRPRAVVWTVARVEHWERTGERPAVAVWTAEQNAAFLHAIRGHRLYAVLDRTTIAALGAHRDRQQAEAAAYGDRYRDSGYVFTNLNSDPVSPGRFTLHRTTPACAGPTRRRSAG